jgi:polar amino acid transport system substrate-binding protein
MKQIIQSYKTGKMELIEVPTPACDNNGILVQTDISLISAGTEKMLIEIAKKSLVGKVRARPDLVIQVLNKVKKEGLKTTLNKVLTKLDLPIPLGYSCSGRVILVGKSVKNISVNDRVACAGAGYANHSEINYIPQNLFARIPAEVSDEEAAYTTVGCISLQGVRQLNPTLGEKIAVIGAGLIGLITVQILKANGCDVLAVDIDPRKLEIAQSCGADLISHGEDLQSAAAEFSRGLGVDGVIIAASSKSKRIVVDAGEICRLKGRVVMVGLTPMDLPRDIYYKKELDFRLSMSYGPGRYDPLYEEHGIDYPLAYVRWTEKRNMESLLSLMAQKKINLNVLTTHRFDFGNILDAYHLISDKSGEHYLGILLKYSSDIIPDVKQITLNIPTTEKVSEIRLGLIGAGNFAQSVILPTIRNQKISFHSVANADSINLINTGRKFGFQKIVSQPDEIFNEKEINTIIIATRHDSHAELIMNGLKSGKHVFSEKPLAITEKQLNNIRKIYEKADRHLMVGYNRRFSPHASFIKRHFKNIQTPLVMNYIVNAGMIETDHWTQNPEIGGGRVIGEVCHFIDFVQYISGSFPVAVYASAIKTTNALYANHDSVQITIDFESGSIANISYHALGDTSLPKEFFEVSGGSVTSKMYDFRRTEKTYRGRTRVFKTRSQEKGFSQEFQLFFNSILNSKPVPITFQSLNVTTLTTFRILESLQSGLKLKL